MAGSGRPPQVPPAPPVVPIQRDALEQAEPTFAPATADVQGVRISGPLFADAGSNQSNGFWGQLRRSPLFVPVLVLLVVFAIVASAYLIGWALPGSSSDATSSTSQPVPFDGQVSWQHDLTATGDCGAGRQVARSGPGKAVDQKSATAWICRGDATGVTLIIRLPHNLEVGQLGLSPGTVSSKRTRTRALQAQGIQAPGNQIRRVRWSLGDTTITQQISGPRADLRAQSIRIPQTRAHTVKLEILEITPGRPAQTAISEVLIGAVD